MSLEGIIAGDFGQPIMLTCKDKDTDNAVDISAYTTSQEMIFKDPDGNMHAETAAFVTDGSDGQVTYTPDDGGDVNDEDGEWYVRARVVKSDAQLTSLWHRYSVLP